MPGPFEPDGAFIKNIRLADGDDSELRESLKSFGWVKEFPALADENGVVLVGHRRIRIAREEGIEPVIQTISFGKGDAADAARLKLALASNIGFQQMTKEDRKRIAEHLYQGEWTMQRIAEALGVAEMTISRDLASSNTVLEPAARPKGGRPKGSLKPERRKNNSPIVEAAAKAVLDEGKTYPEVEAAVGLSNTVLRSAVAREEGRREERAEPKINPADLSLSAQQKLEIAIRQHKRKLDMQFEDRVREEFMSRIKTWLDHFNKVEATYKTVIKSRQGFMSEAVHKLILRCLHPDSRASLSDRMLQEAFREWNRLKLVLVAERENPVLPQFPDMPKTAVDLIKRKEAVTRERQARRAARQPSRQPSSLN